VQPRYILLGGIIGAFITYTVIKAVDKLGPAKAVMIIVISQLLTAYLIELFGMFGTEKVSFSIRKIIGLILAIIGIVIFKWNC
jgi:transporter family-2 protein